MLPSKSFEGRHIHHHDDPEFHRIMNFHQEPSDGTSAPDCHRKRIADKLSASGARNANLWMALFDVSRAVADGQPIEEMPNWNSICDTVEKLYQLSCSDPREFSIVQTLTTVIHQEQSVNRILAACSKLTSESASNGSGLSAKDAILPDLAEIRKEIQVLSDRVNEQLGAFASIQQRFKDLGKFVENPDGFDDENSFPISCEQLKEVEHLLVRQFDSLSPNVDVLLDEDYYRSTVGQTSDYVLYTLKKSYARAKQYTDPGVPVGIVFILSLMMRRIQPKNTTKAFEEMRSYIHQISISKPAGTNKELLIRNSIRRSHVYCKCTMHC